MTDGDIPADRLEELTAISGLGEPTRRALYEYVAGSDGWVGRDQAADAVGLERGTAAHHLDRLAADGLLDVDFQRLSGRRGPGAGRPAKLYRRARREFGVSLPPREYELAAAMLADAADRSRLDGTDIVTALEQVAGDRGRQLASSIHDRLGGRRATKRVREEVLGALAALGFEPRPGEGGAVIFRNCPFHRLAQGHTDLICGMNLCLMQAVCESVAASGLESRLEPEDGMCCVKLYPAG